MNKINEKNMWKIHENMVETIVYLIWNHIHKRKHNATDRWALITRCTIAYVVGLVDLSKDMNRETTRNEMKPCEYDNGIRAIERCVRAMSEEIQGSNRITDQCDARWAHTVRYWEAAVTPTWADERGRTSMAACAWAYPLWAWQRSPWVTHYHYHDSVSTTLL